ncbi:MAG: ornithine cyclodeaminase family protein [Candidatus Eisenbacteria bacterium]|uniref:Ornithine cyclodeaminase family protein n=1 Tax=Eiseniibacteriota bacterium TaxID=2212470 RepID=A0A948W6C2_UNCEI|nr:ornithine cyclodeaminase family protein [Candidatus Eisenbacteria bacterium]MBU2690491.1 ornithine cyclodeaminase family protein [Candidatus Eisenbacteria bacterium]
MPLLISRKDVEKVLTMKDCIIAVEKAFAELANGRTIMPQRAVIPISDHKGVFLGMPAYIGGEMNALGIKIVTVYPENPKKYNIPTIFGTLSLCDPATGRTIAIMDAGYLTAVRTGAASGVATKFLAREDSKIAVIFGAGVQAQKQLEAVHMLRPLEKVYVLDLVTKARDKFAHDMSETFGIEMIPTDDAEMAVKDSDIIITASSSPNPVFDGNWMKPGTHINNIGSHSPTARELDTTTVKRSKFVADLKEANLAEAGDILIPIKEGAVTQDHIYASLGEIVTGRKAGRENPKEITLFKSCGLAIQDISTALSIYTAAREKGIGTEVEL